MNILSLFDGISCGQLALQRAGVHVDKYYASEIEPNAIKVTQHNFPDTIQLGDVTKWQEWDIDWASIDLLIGGSPCQGFSFAGKELAFDDPRSKLFFVYVDILNHIRSVNPSVKFLFENVKMKKEYLDVISEQLGIEPVFINSALVSAQNRQRYYWANWEFGQPIDKGIKLIDILEDTGTIGPSAIRGKRLNKAIILGRRLNDKGKREDYNKEIPITQCLEVRATNRDKSNCLTTVAKDNVLTTMPIGRHPDAFKNNLPFRYYTIKEYCRLQTVPENYFDGVASENQIRKMLGNGWTVDVISHIFKGLL
jgi:site-specific DNA-cytosine methylase